MICVVAHDRIELRMHDWLAAHEIQTPDLGKRTEIAYPRSGTVPIFAEALRSENGTVPFTPASGMSPNRVY
jgi:hypothetical protein